MTPAKIMKAKIILSILSLPIKRTSHKQASFSKSGVNNDSKIRPFNSLSSTKNSSIYRFELRSNKINPNENANNLNSQQKSSENEANFIIIFRFIIQHEEQPATKVRRNLLLGKIRFIWQQQSRRISCALSSQK